MTRILVAEDDRDIRELVRDVLQHAGFEVALDADPPVSCTFHGLHPPVIGENPEIGLTGPAMHCVNAIPYVVDADPGIKTYLDLPLLAGRAAPITAR